MPKSIDDKCWLNSRFNNAIEDGKLESILYFSLFWNLFEHKYFQDNYTHGKIKQAFNKISSDYENIKNKLDDIIDFLKKRYLNSGIFNELYRTLNLRRNDNEQVVEDVFLGTKTDDKSIFISLITIIGRFRNNFFHGLKEPPEIVFQNDIFAYINAYLSKLLDL